MLRKRTIPSKPRFAFAVRRAYEVLADIGSTTLPIDPFRIGEHYPEIHIVSYTELKENTACADPFDFDKRNAQNAFLETLTRRSSSDRIDGETHKYRGDKEYLVVYDDRIGSEHRIRWTIAPELGHIFLGHFVEFALTSFLRGAGGDERIGLTDEEYGVLEVEAHFFAAAFISPATVIRKIAGCQSVMGIMETCGISEDAAYKRLDELKRLPCGSYEVEDLLNRNFYNYIWKANNPEAAVFDPPLDALPSQYEDYADYEYWAYIVALFGKSAKYTALGIALTDSTAIYEGDDMLIITETETVKAMADKHETVIKAALSKYGKTGIQSVSSLSAEALVLLS
jgi:Zn-dependent peptidase ImmA (M78 family)